MIVEFRLESVKVFRVMILRNLVESREVVSRLGFILKDYSKNVIFLRRSFEELKGALSVAIDNCNALIV